MVSLNLVIWGSIERIIGFANRPLLLFDRRAAISVAAVATAGRATQVDKSSNRGLVHGFSVDVPD